MGDNTYRVLVTGGAGYKGTLLVEALLAAGHQVTLMDNFMYGLDHALPFGGHPRCKVILRDIRNLQRADVAGYDFVYHLAGISGYPACEANPHAAKVINVDATKILVDILERDTVLCYASTTSMYGASGKAMDETAKPEPSSLYGITKLEAERICMQRPNAIAFRFATLFGASIKMRCDLLVNDFVYKAVTERNLVLYGGESVRTFLHVRDAIRAYLMALDHREPMVGGIFNVGTAAMNYSKRQVAEMIASHIPVKIILSEMLDPDPRNFIVNFDKLAALGFRGTIDMDAGIRELIALYQWYQPNRPFATI